MSLPMMFPFNKLCVDALDNMVFSQKVLEQFVFRDLFTILMTDVVREIV